MKIALLLAFLSFSSFSLADDRLIEKNFVRAVVLEQKPKEEGSTNAPGWTFRVKDQINGAANNSRIVAAAAVRMLARMATHMPM